MKKSFPSPKHHQVCQPGLSSGIQRQSPRDQASSRPTFLPRSLSRLHGHNQVLNLETAEEWMEFFHRGKWWGWGHHSCLTIPLPALPGKERLGIYDFPFALLLILRICQQITQPTVKQLAPWKWDGWKTILSFWDCKFWVLNWQISWDGIKEISWNLMINMWWYTNIYNNNHDDCIQ